VGSPQKEGKVAEEEERKSIPTGWRRDLNPQFTASAMSTYQIATI